MTLKLNHFGFISQFASITLMILGTLFIFSNNVSAIDDKVVTFNSGFADGSFTRDICSRGECNSFKYITITNTGTNLNSNANFSVSISSVNVCTIRPYSTSSVICELNQAIGNVAVGGSFTNWSMGFNGSITITLSENNPTAGGSTPCPEPEPCDCDTPPIVAFFRDVFLNVVTGIIPAFAVFVVVWFMVDMLSSLWFGRGK